MRRRALLPTLALALLGLGAVEDPRPERIAKAATDAKFNGEILVGAGEQIIVDRGFGNMVASGNTEIIVDGRFEPGLVWPWASVTKQVIATLLMQQIADGKVVLDAPAGRYLPALAKGLPSPSVRELLQHRSGLRNPDDTAARPGGIPAFYAARDDAASWCLARRAAAGGNWRYNNCDYIVLGTLLEQVTGMSVQALYAQCIARPAGIAAQFVAPDDVLALGWLGQAEAGDRALLARFGAAGGLAGTARDLWSFDRALMRGQLIDKTALATMWTGDPKLGFQALGQWSFTAALKGCPAPVRIIERRGGIGRFQARNFLLPDESMSIIVFTNRGEEAFDFGEVWQGKGFSYDLLSAAACA